MPYILTLLIFFSLFVEGADLGTFGTTFPIEEDDLLLVLQERLSNAEYDEVKKQEVMNAFVDSINVPKGRKLPKAVVAKSYAFDPTFVLQEDIKDNDGKIIIAKGSSVNPLEKTPTSRRLTIHRRVRHRPSFMGQEAHWKVDFG